MDELDQKLQHVGVNDGNVGFGDTGGKSAGKGGSRNDDPINIKDVKLPILAEDKPSVAVFKK